MSGTLRLIATILVAAFSSTTFAATITTLDFANWDAAALSQDGGRQHFENAADGLDVTVTAIGDFDAPATYVATLDGGDDAIRSEHAPASEQQCHGYEFLFSKSTNVLFETKSLDGQEEYKFTSPGTLRYTNESGAEPLVTSMSGMLHLDGVAYGRDPAVGSSDGVTFISAPEGGAYPVTLSYCADPTLGASNVIKYGSFRVAAVSSAVTQLPEPNPMGLLAIGLLSLLGVRTRR